MSSNSLQETQEDDNIDEEEFFANSEGDESDQEIETTSIDNKYDDIISEQRRKLEEKNQKTQFTSLQEIKNFNNSENSSDDMEFFESSDDEKEQNKPDDTFTEQNNDQELPQSVIDVDKILQDYQNLSQFEDEEMIQQKSTSTKRSIHPNKIFNLSITSVCTLFGISCGFIISHFTLYSIGFISVIILISILLIGLGFWFGATEVIEEKVTVTQARLPVTNVLSRRAINLWKSAECQTLSQQQENTSSKTYVNEETRERFADKDDDEQFDVDINIISQLRANESDNDVEEIDFSDDSSDKSLDENENNIYTYSDKANENSHSSKQQKPKLTFVDVDYTTKALHPRKVKRGGEKDHTIYGPIIPSFVTGKWTSSKSDDFENFEEEWKNLSNIILRDDLVGQRNSIVPNIRMKNEDDYRSSRIFTEIEMGNIKNNVNQHREELFNFGVDNTHYEPVIAPPKVRDLCKIRKLVLKFE
ncbi:predicted protein [Naegleria gruberi]|uniref:Predicted protein n=1 Tax=Naegleria gruberi TaxID=5762 RepID=D2UXJ6_NAEGR|nr:uncharacterized protein NAEGRDRAFT_61148 [Naegleria gruberi]EFC50644.1 predicted protein [Naegleria gruberi]|eukprot:XP_002683388.1 predicted protein [Naegleria gruberi strain NEG-M]